MSKTINGMSASELKQLLKDTIDKINQIDGSVEKIDKNLWRSDESSGKVTILLNDITEAYHEVYGFEWDENFKQKDSKLEKIKNAYAEIITGSGDNKSLKAQIEALITYIEEKKTEVDTFKKQVFWYTNKKEDWTEEKVWWLFDNINNFHTAQKEKFQTLYEKIDEELTAWTTSVALAKVFSDKVEQYKNAWIFWQVLFIITISWLLYIVNWTFETDDWKKLTVKMISHLPFFALSVWFLIFLWNRRAEAKKLEEWYKHKEVMARSFIWYKKSIEELESDLSSEDKELMKLHMKNLLHTIHQDTSSFLNSKWENHPLFDALHGHFKKENFPNWSIETEFWKIEFNKK